MRLEESLIHYVWQHYSRGIFSFTTTRNEPITVIRTGIPNRHEGPDFREVEIRISGITWLGNVEIHVRSSDWLKHGHQWNAGYENVILHVVYYHDRELEYPDGRVMPVLELSRVIDRAQWEVYRSLMYNQLDVPCQQMIHRAVRPALDQMLDKAAQVRMKHKCDAIRNLVDELDGNWNRAFYYQLAESFGFKINAQSMLALARSIDLRIIEKNKDEPENLAALCFGQAGILPSSSADEYLKDLASRYSFLQLKYGLNPPTFLNWHRAGTRMANYPAIRIAQWVALLAHSSHLFSELMQVDDVGAYASLFRKNPNVYWSAHYDFGKKRKVPRTPLLGSSAVNLLLINTVAPFLMAYGRYTGQEPLNNRAI